MATLSVFIVCWPGKESNAELIARQIHGHVDQLVVIYSTKDTSTLNGFGDWVQVPDSWYYGKKFARSLELNVCSHMLHIQADAHFDDWKILIDQFKHATHNLGNLGIWSPDCNNTVWNTSSVKILPSPDKRYVFVAQTDCIVWGMTEPVIRRLKLLDYEFNNLGWGIDWVAVTFCFTRNLLVARDLWVAVRHEMGTGYETNEAAKEMSKFLKQLSPQEKIMYKLLNQFINSRRPESPNNLFTTN